MTSTDTTSTISYVYAISKDDKGSLVKIGRSNNPEKRLKGLQNASGHSLVILHAIKCPSTRVAADLERALHYWFRSKRMRNGEWFGSRIKPILTALIAFSFEPETSSVCGTYAKWVYKEPPDDFLLLQHLSGRNGKLPLKAWGKRWRDWNKVERKQRLARNAAKRLKQRKT